MDIFLLRENFQSYMMRSETVGHNRRKIMIITGLGGITVFLLLLATSPDIQSTILGLFVGEQPSQPYLEIDPGEVAYSWSVTSGSG